MKYYTLEDIEKLLETSLKLVELKQIATERFHGDTYGSKAVLKEKIKYWIESERTLKTIERLASKPLTEA